MATQYSVCKAPTTCTAIMMLVLLMNVFTLSVATATPTPELITTARPDAVWSAGNNWTSLSVFADDSFVIDVDGALFANHSGDVALHANGLWLRRSAKTLVRSSNSSAVSGVHAGLGKWIGFQTNWATVGGSVIMSTTIQYFTESESFVFEQRFPEGAQNTSLGDVGTNTLNKEPLGQTLSQWPSFTAESLTWDVMAWMGSFSDQTMMGKLPWGISGDFLSLVGGPLLMWNATGDSIETCTGAVFSTFDNFKTGIWGGTWNQPSSQQGARSHDSNNSNNDTCTVQKGINYVHQDIFGDSDLKKYNVTKDYTGGECCGWCTGFANCSAWTICNGCPAPYTDICFLKTGIDGRKTSGQISGIRNAPSPPETNEFLVAGIHGGITSLPHNHSTSFLFVAPRKMCRVQTMKQWGTVLQTAYNTDRATWHARDPATSQLGYWTDNAAAYDWYHWTVADIVAGKGPGGKLPATQLIEVQQAIAAAHLPVRYYQLDAYWYYAQGPDWLLCAMDWITEKQLFPDGLLNMSKAMSSPLDKDGMGLMLYIPEVCANNSYSDRYTFLKSFTKIPNTGPIALISPDEAEAFYGELMDWGLHNGNMVSFEVDFMDDQLSSFPQLLQNIGLAEQWQAGIGAAAIKRNISVQLCMEYPNELMTSLLSSSITNARGSGDGGSNVAGFAASSLLMSSLGVSPSTDNFFSGDEKGKRSEFRTILAVYSRGPVGFGDAVNAFNASLLMRTCGVDGTLLQPSETALLLDRPTYWEMTDRATNIMTTVSRVGEFVFAFVLAFSSKATEKFPSPFLVRYAELPELMNNNFNNNNKKTNTNNNNSNGSLTTYFTYRLDDDACVENVAAADCLHVFDEAHALAATDKFSMDSAIFVVSPSFGSSATSWILLGETSKFVPLSAKRITDINTATNTITIKGAVGEHVKFFAANGIAGTVKAFDVTIDNTGTAMISLGGGV